MHGAQPDIPQQSDLEGEADGRVRRVTRVHAEDDLAVAVRRGRAGGTVRHHHDGAGGRADDGEEGQLLLGIRGITPARTGPRSWVTSPREVFVRIEPELVTGRELVGGRTLYGVTPEF